MRRILLTLLACLITLPALAAESLRFYDPCWAGASGQDGKGGVSLVSRGETVKFLIDKASCPVKIDRDVLNDSPQWIVWHDDGEGDALGFDFTWITTDKDKFWGKRWAGGGMAFNRSWGAMDLTGAKFLIMAVKTTHSGVDFGLSLVGEDDKGTGEVKLSDYAIGRRIGKDWTKVVIPLSALPGISGFNKAMTRQIRLNLLGDYPENVKVSTRFSNIYFSGSGLMTPVDKLGWLELSDGAMLVWDMEGSDALKGFRVRIDGKEVGRQVASKRRVKIPAKLLPKGAHVVEVASFSDDKVSDYQGVTVSLGSTPYASASVSLSGELTHEISPLIYGLNGWEQDTKALKKMGITLSRWGGNATTSYNWKDDVFNRCADWFFLNTAESVDPKQESDKSYYKFFKTALDAGADVMSTIPLIGWTPKPPPKDGRLSSYPISLFPGQENDDAGAGNGRYKDGSRIWGNDPNHNYFKTDVDFQQEWVETCVRHFGTAANGGIRLYSMDNEIALWPFTHQDIAPQGIGYEEMVDLNSRYAAMVKKVDPSAEIVGLVAWGVKELAGSARDFFPNGKEGYKLGESGIKDEQKWTDRRAHDNLPQFHYYLREMRKRSEQAGVRLVDYVDTHGFPEVWGRNKAGNNIKLLTEDTPYEKELAQEQFEALRIFWDDTFIDEDSWCYAHGNAEYLWNDWVGFIPKLKGYIAQYYPSTKLAMTEYYPASKSYFHGGLLQAVNLGIFAREGMDLACNWGGVGQNSYVELAHKLFGNYDDKGSKFLGRYAPTTSSSGDLYAFGAKDGAATKLVLVNRNPDQGFQTTVTLPAAAATYTTYLYAQTLGKRIFELGTQKTSGAVLRVRVPAFSAVLIAAQ